MALGESFAITIKYLPVMFQLLLGFFQSLLRRIKLVLTSLKCCLIFDKLILTVLETLLVLTKLVLTIRKCLLIFAQLLFNDLSYDPLH